MGFADMLVDLAVPYDSAEAVETAEQVMGRIHRRARRASAELARERGVFPHFEGSRAEAAGERLRNATVTSIAPTGTLSIIAGCSSGIEPYFALAFVRHVLDGERLPETNPRFEAALRRAGAWSELLVEQVRRTGSVRGNPAVPESLRRLFPIASEIEPSAHLDIQAAFQRHVDNAVSKTINLRSSATVEEVEAIYTDAWRRGLKGVTVFREESRGAAVLRRGMGGHLEAAADFTGPCNTERCE
jgi:ribonucleoside-diphosphate reductase alpha chain